MGGAMDEETTPRGPAEDTAAGDRDARTGRFLKGHQPQPGPRDQASRTFKTWLRRFFEEPETVELIRAKVRRDLQGDGPATFAIRMIAYAHGEPRHIIEHEVKGEIERVAREAGIDPQELFAAAEQLVPAN